MSSSYYSCIFCINPEELPSNYMDLKSSDDVSDLTSLKRHGDEENNEFLIQTLTDDYSVAEGLLYVSDTYKVDGLKFAEKELAILDTEKIENALKDVNFILEESELGQYASQVDSFYPLDVDCWYEEFEFAVDFDGDYPYLMWYLISIKKMFENALNNGSYIVYVLILP